MTCLWTVHEVTPFGNPINIFHGLWNGVSDCCIWYHRPGEETIRPWRTHVSTSGLWRRESARPRLSGSRLVGSNFGTMLTLDEVGSFKGVRECPFQSFSFCSSEKSLESKVDVGLDYRKRWVLWSPFLRFPSPSTFTLSETNHERELATMDI